MQLTTLSPNRLLELSLEIATEAHEGQFYGSEPYIVHPMAVASLSEELGYPAEVQAACLLHDVVEDSRFTTHDLIVVGLPLIVVEGVDAVTFTEEEKRRGVDKIGKAMSHPLGHVVKFCDSSGNLAASVENDEQLPPDALMERMVNYTGKVGRLVVGLPSPEDICLLLN